MTIFGLSLENRTPCAGRDVRTFAGRATLAVLTDQAISLTTSNPAKMAIGPEEIVLTGGMANWAYPVVFHYLHGKTKRIYYEDGRGQRMLVAAHG